METLIFLFSGSEASVVYTLLSGSMVETLFLLPFEDTFLCIWHGKDLSSASVRHIAA